MLRAESDNQIRTMGKMQNPHPRIIDSKRYPCSKLNPRRTIKVVTFNFTTFAYHVLHFNDVGCSRIYHNLQK